MNYLCAFKNLQNHLNQSRQTAKTKEHLNC